MRGKCLERIFFRRFKAVVFSTAVACAGLLASTAVATDFVVNSTADTDDGACNTSPDCTLREALNAANSNTGPDTVSFAGLPGGGPWTIAPATSLPGLLDATGGTNIDGTTAPGYAGMPRVAIDGSAVTIGIFIASSNNTVQGLVIQNVLGVFGAGIDLTLMWSQMSGNVIADNFIGTDFTGTLDRGNDGDGVRVLSLVGSSNTIANNLISGNGGSGLVLGGTGSNNIVQSNTIGADISGTQALPNGNGGIWLNGDDDVPSSDTVDDNLISGNVGDGVVVGSSDDVLTRNWIGLDANGAPLGNSGHGIFVAGGVDSSIGGLNPGEGNVIAFNDLDGVHIRTFAASSGHAILGNSIFENGGLAIDLGADGPTPNDAGDGDSGANELQNYPLLTALTGGSSGIAVVGTLDSAPLTQYRLEFFLNASCDPSGHGEGEEFLGGADITTDATGTAAFSVELAVSGAGEMTATATDLSGNTSELSKCLDALVFVDGFESGNTSAWSSTVP